MGSVIPLKRIDTPSVEAPVEFHRPHAARHLVDAAYARLSKATGYHNRPEQQALSHEVAAAILDNKPLISEAPTGSGKTIGYSIGALAAGRELGLPLVIATATVALQGQVMDSDLKRVEATGLVKPGSYKLVRGRGRFFCQVAAQAAMGNGDAAASFQPELFDEASELKAEDLFDAGRLAPTLLAALEDGSWDGTRDALPKNVYIPRPSVWHHLSSSPDSCLRQNCEHYKSCPFFQARAQWEGAEVLVANHHLVLLDLMAAGTEGGQPVFPFKEYILVVDEAHHLPDTALSTKQHAFRLGAFLEQLQRMELVLRDVYRNPEVSSALSMKLSTNPRATIRQLRDKTAVVLKALAAAGVSETSFDSGGVMGVSRDWAPEVRAAVDAMTGDFLELMESLRRILAYLPNAARNHSNPTQFQVMQSALGAVSSQIKSQHEGALAFMSREVIWLSRQLCTHLEQGWQPVFNGSPLEGKGILKELLWAKKRARVIMVSATVRGTTGFEHFKDQMGLEDPTPDNQMPEVRTQVLPSRFAYESTPLARVVMKALPGEQDFVPELMSLLPEVITPRKDKGTLVLFTNRKTMALAYERLRMEFGDLVISQDSHGGALKVKALHCERIDSGMPSILLGVKSLAEGFDLPGHYCTHLVVTQLPFEAPTGPLERARQEAYGKAYFAEHTLPRTARELKQITGRLLRREDDYGRISMMDNRLWRKSYGSSLLSSLPPYKAARVELTPASSVVSMPGSFR